MGGVRTEAMGWDSEVVRRSQVYRYGTAGGMGFCRGEAPVMCSEGEDW